MQDTIDLIITTLEAGMTTGHTDSDDYYVKTWYMSDPIAMPDMETPAGMCKIDEPTSYESVFVGMDAPTETYVIQFYAKAARKAGENAEHAPGMTRLIAMCEKVKQLLRADPTFGSQFVTSKITGVKCPLPGVPESDIYRIGQIRFEVKRRELWGA